MSSATNCVVHSEELPSSWSYNPRACSRQTCRRCQSQSWGTWAPADQRREHFSCALDIAGAAMHNSGTVNMSMHLLKVVRVGLHRVER